MKVVLCVKVLNQSKHVEDEANNFSYENPREQWDSMNICLVPCKLKLFCVYFSKLTAVLLFSAPFITVPLFCQTKTFFKRKGMRCFPPILITEVSVCQALGCRRRCDSCSLLKISTRGFYFFFWLHLPNLAKWLMAEGQLWSDEMEYTQHRLLERPVESWAHRITTWLLCISRRLKNVFVFALESSLNQIFQSISKAVRVIQQSEG